MNAPTPRPVFEIVPLATHPVKFRVHAESTYPMKIPDSLDEVAPPVIVELTLVLVTVTEPVDFQ